jgi:valyl-tRNA synthetase
VGSWELFVPLADLVDLEAERRRMEREIELLMERHRAKRARLDDPGFRQKAPAEVVAEEEESLRHIEEELARWRRWLQQIE